MYNALYHSYNWEGLKYQFYDDCILYCVESLFDLHLVGRMESKVNYTSIDLKTRVQPANSKSQDGFCH